VRPMRQSRARQARAIARASGIPPRNMHCGPSMGLEPEPTPSRPSAPSFGCSRTVLLRVNAAAPLGRNATTESSSAPGRRHTPHLP
jgi:hypothetical protein